MLKRSLFKAAVVIIVALAMILPASAVMTNTKIKAIGDAKPIPMGEGRTVIFQDGFENYTDFDIEFPPWTNTDVDGGSTYGMTSITWPNQFQPQAYIIFNPSTTSPPVTDPEAAPHAGLKYAACFADVPSSAPNGNNDWLITPQLNSAQYGAVTFWARSYVSTYGLERFKVGISTTDTNPASFTIISPGSYVEAPTAWTQFTYNLSQYNGNIYIAINCISYDAFIFMVDDFAVTGSGGQGITHHHTLPSH